MCAEWEGEGDVAYDVFAIDELHSAALSCTLGIGRYRTHLRHSTRAVLGWDSCLLMPTWIVRMVTGVVPGEWPGTGRGFGPCLMLHARLETGNNGG